MCINSVTGETTSAVAALPYYRHTRLLSVVRTILPIEGLQFTVYVETAQFASFVAAVKLPMAARPQYFVSRAFLQPFKLLHMAQWDWDMQEVSPVAYIRQRNGACRRIGNVSPRC
jgi:hypothetical protein